MQTLPVTVVIDFIRLVTAFKMLHQCAPSFIVSNPRLYINNYTATGRCQHRVILHNRSKHCIMLCRHYIVYWSNMALSFANTALWCSDFLTSVFWQFIVLCNRCIVYVFLGHKYKLLMRMCTQIVSAEKTFKMPTYRTFYEECAYVQSACTVKPNAW